MKIFVAGATGVLGRRLVRQFTERGHSVAGLVRSDEGAERVRRAGGVPVRADLFDAEALARAAEGAEVVIHAATSIPISPRGAKKAWAMNDRIRREGTRALTAAAAKVGARVYLQQSVVWVMRPPHDAPYTEATTPDPAPVLLSAVEGEAIAREAGERHGFAVGVLRCGMFYAADTGHTRMMAQELMKGRLPIIGRGENIAAPLHVDDAASAFVAAAEAGRAGIWHVIDMEPLPMGRLIRAFAEMLGAPPPRRVPVWLARLLAGKAAVDTMTASMRTTNAAFVRDVGWKPRYPTYREGLAEVIRSWREEGFLGGRR